MSQSHRLLGEFTFACGMNMIWGKLVVEGG
jgi:plastocyanin domain-containing protein